MEKRYQSLSLFEFQQTFNDERNCMDHLAKLKWADGFECERCGNSTVEVSLNILDSVPDVGIRPHQPAVHCSTNLNFHLLKPFISFTS